MTIGAEIDGRSVFSIAEHACERRAGGQRPLGRPLDDRAVGQRIRERHADLEDVGAGLVEPLRISAERVRSGSPAVT